MRSMSVGLDLYVSVILAPAMPRVRPARVRPAVPGAWEGVDE